MQEAMPSEEVGRIRALRAFWLAPRLGGSAWQAAAASFLMFAVGQLVVTDP